LILRAMAAMKHPVRLVLRGEPHRGYVRDLAGLAAALNIPHRLSIEPLAPPDSMVALASGYDILVGSQPGEELFHQLAIGNKVFTGLMAGLAVALSDTIAHRELIGDGVDWGFIMARDPRQLARQLDMVLETSGRLEAMKSAAWQAAGALYNWDVDSRRLLGVIGQMRPRAVA
jgi:glycosyltransferase involved in cell wall biosynthesis